MRITGSSMALAAMFMLWLAPASQALLVGPVAGSNPTTQLSWNISDPNYELELTEVEISSGAPYWIKRLIAEGNVNGEDRPVITEGETITLTEHLQVGGQIPMVDWREIFSSDGWSFVDAAVYHGDTDDLVDGLDVTISQGASGPIDEHFDNLLVSFDALEPGAIIRIEKTMRYDGLDVLIGSEQWGDDDIIIRQFPDTIIPEPMSIGMIAAGGGMFGLMRRRRRASSQN